jgi:nicotinamide phosphoribosyltransferase
VNIFEDARYEVYLSIDGNYYLKEDWEGNAWGDRFVKENAKPISEVEVKGAVQVLWETFGGTETSTGYKMLDSHVGLIYGDSITLERAKAILERLEAKGFASGNVVFGIGSYTYEYVTRDTFGFAMKATAGSVNGELREIFKDPATDSGTKKSAKGLLRVEFENGSYVLYDQQTPEQEEQGCLQTVFKDGKLFNGQTLGEIRQRLKNQ